MEYLKESFSFEKMLNMNLYVPLKNFFFKGGLPKAYPDNHLSQVDVNELFSKLLKTGILKLSQPDSATTREYGCIFHIQQS